MKKFTRLLALVLAVALVAVCFAGCGNKQGNAAGKGNTAKDIKVSYWNAGYGDAWIKATAERFEKAYPEYNVELNITASDGAILNTFGMQDIDDTDVYLVSAPVIDKLEYFEPLNDILDMTAYGDSVPLKDKFDADYIARSTFEDGNVYVLPAVSSGAMAMVYNKKIFKDNNLTVPRTTGELTVVADALAAKKIPAIVSFKGAGYFDQALYVWYAQYEGVDYYNNNFLACVDPETGKSPSKDLFTRKDARYEILTALEGFLTPQYVLTGSNSQTHTIMQTEFVHGNAAMMYNGGWIENEAASAGSMEDFGVFRLPVISTITNKLSTVKTEGDLRKLITAVDNVLDGKKELTDYQSGADYNVEGKTVSAADWEHIYSARSTTYGSSISSGIYIPKYSTAIEGAKTFISYIFSDENGKAIAKDQHYALGGLKLGAIEIDTSDWSPLAQEFYAISASYTNFVSEYSTKTHKIFTDGGASLWAGINFIPHYITNNTADRWDADKAWDKILAEVNSKYTNTWLYSIT